MAVTADRVVVELEARLDRYEANVARAEAKFDKAMTGIQKSAGSTEKFVGTAMRSMTAALAGVSVIALTRQFLSLADEAKKLDATLKLATAGFGSFGQAQKDVRAIADETRSGLSETASLYANFVRGAKELGGTQAEAARATETFSKSLKISGADAQQAASATLQFGQALAAGALRGDELNSILEASPRLARLLAESMGKPIGQIKQLGEQGLLTSDKLLKALTDKKFTSGIDAEFKELPITFDDAMTKVSNAALVTFSAFDRGGEFSTALANFVSDGSDGFADLEKAAMNFGTTVRAEVDGAVAIFHQAIETVDTLGGAFDSLVDGPVGRFIAKLNDIAGYLNPLNDLVGIIRSNGAYQSAANTSRAKAQLRQGERWIQQASSGYDILGNPVAGTPGGPQTKAAAATSSGKKSGGTKKPPLNPEAFAREESSLNDQILRLKEEQAQTIEESARFELDRLASGKAAAIADINSDKRYTAAQKQQIVALTETVSAMEAAKVIRERDYELAKRAFDEATDANRSQQDLLQSQLDLATTREEQYAIEQRILKLKQSQERAEYELLTQSNNAVDVARGKAGLASLDQRQPNETAALGRSYQSPLERYASGADRGSVSDQIENYVIDELESVQDSITSAITKKLGVKDPLLSSLIELFIQQQLIQPLAQALSGAGSLGSAGGIIGAVGGLLGFTSGGSMSIGGRGGTDTNTLSLNGRPIANVSRGETLSVGSKALSGRSDATVVQPVIQVDARGAVMNDQFAQMILAQANQGAIQAAAAMGKQVNQNVPARMAQYSRDGT